MLSEGNSWRGARGRGSRVGRALLLVGAWAAWSGAGWAAETGPGTAKAATTNTAPTHATVFVVQDPAATRDFLADAAVVRRMVDRGLAGFTGKARPKDAWALYVRPTDVVGFKVTSAPGPVSGTRPEVVGALVESLLSAGHPARQIVIWDKRAGDLVLGGYAKVAERLGVRWAAVEELGWDESAESYDVPYVGRLVFGDHEFGRKQEGNVGRRSFVSRLLTKDVTRIITVAPALNHHQTGVNGHLLNLALGSVDNTLRFEGEAARLAEAVPEICALDPLAPHLAFCVTDALVCQYRGEDRTLLHYAVALNELRFSTDPVALDVLALADINKARKDNPTDGEKPVKTELYVNAAAAELGVADEKQIEVRRAP